MELGPVAKLDKRNNAKKIDDDGMLKIVTSLSLFRFTINFEQSGSRIPDA